MAFLIKTLQFLSGLSIIVGIHELGHLLFAKLFKMQVNSYMIGFPPKIFKTKIGSTEYALGSIPLGGAVQIAGMVDESLDTDCLSSNPKPWEFRSKPAWQRLIVILGGIIFNLVSGTLIFSGLAYVRGYTYLPKDVVNKYGITPGIIAAQMGFKEGDKIIKINGKDFQDFSDTYSPSLLLRHKSYYTINRDGVELDLPIPEQMIESLSEQKSNKESGYFLLPIYPCYITAVVPNSSADLAGLTTGDQIIELANQPTPYFHQLLKVKNAHLGKEVEMAYVRNGIKKTVLITLGQSKENSTIGFTIDSHKYETRSYSLIQSIPAGLNEAMKIIQNNFLGIWKLITGKLSIKKSLGGPISIAQAFESKWIGHRFWQIIASLSIAIGLTNLLPLPALDGGHALFILYEIVIGRKLPDRFLQITQKIGMILLLLIILYVFSNDIRKYCYW